MNSIILDKKPIIIKDGEEIVDLTFGTLKYQDQEPVIIDKFYVGEDMVMRADLISYIAFGNTDNYDIILKFNGISNPFSIDKETYILVPEPRYMYNQLLDGNDKDLADEVRNQYLDESKDNKTDPNKIEYDKAIENLRKSVTGVKFSNYPLPPNFAEPGSKEGNTSSDGSKVSL